MTARTRAISSRAWAIDDSIRTHVTEAPIFLEAKALVEKEQAVSYGVFEVVRKYPKGILQAMGMTEPMVRRIRLADPTWIQSADP